MGGFQLCVDAHGDTWTMAFVEKQNRIRIVAITPDLERMQYGTPDVRSAEEVVGPEDRHMLRGHSGYIVAMEYRDGIVVSLATDRRLCVWDGRTGKRLGMCAAVSGSFVPGYPYIVRRAPAQSNKVFYTCEEGVFMVVF